MNKKKLQHIMANIKSFPPMPGMAMKLLSLLRDPEVIVSQIEGILRKDPALTANVLKLTNSAYFGFPSEIASVRQALVLLGSKKLIQLVLTSSAKAVLDKPVVGYDLSAGELWKHAIAVSVSAEALVKELEIPAGDVVFTAALLHDVGKLILGSFVADDLAEIEATASEEIPFDVAEQMVLGTNHAEVGALILKKWSFPSEIIAAAQWHHDPDAAEQSKRLVDIVHVANVVSQMSGIGAGRDGLQYEPSAGATSRLKLKPFQLEKVASYTLQWMHELSDALEAH